MCIYIINHPQLITIGCDFNPWYQIFPGLSIAFIGLRVEAPGRGSRDGPGGDTALPGALDGNGDSFSAGKLSLLAANRRNVMSRSVSM